MVSGWPNLSNPADSVFFFILGISLTLLVLVTGVMIYFVIRYRRTKSPVAQDVKDSVAIEVIWTVIPTALVLAIFFAGWKGFQYMRTVPPDAMPVKAAARQWSWTFTYGNGKQDSILRVPVRKPVKLLITSDDVLHSLYIPAYRIKEDAVPGRETYLWFLPDEVGSYDLFCSEYCGVGHSAMITRVEVMSERDFDAWYQSNEEQRHAESHEHAGKESSRKEGPDGAKLINTKGCVACHSIDGSPKVGPTFKGLFGKNETVIHDGKEQQLVADEKFIHEKLLRPEINRIKGYPPIMPSQQGQLTDEEIEAIVRHLKVLK